MPLLSARLTMLVGPTVPIPAPATMMETLQSVTVTTSDEGRSGFQIVFAAGRSGMLNSDYTLMIGNMLKPFNRVILMVTLGLMPQVLIDGIITTQELTPEPSTGRATLTITGEDVSVMMDLKEVSTEHPSQNATMIATLIMAQYATYGIIPKVVPPLTDLIPLPLERIPVQHGTDLEYIEELAEMFGYVFYIQPGPMPGMNTGYWGPPVRLGLPQKALTINMGQATNVETISFSYNGLAPTLVSGKVQDFKTQMTVPVQTLMSTRVPPLASMPALIANLPNVRTQQLRHWGLDATLSLSRAQGITDRSVDGVVTATGELDAIRYGTILMPFGLVGVRGAGFNNDGFWYVQSVTHTITEKSYKQQFVLAREGPGSTTPAVIP